MVPQALVVLAHHKLQVTTLFIFRSQHSVRFLPDTVHLLHQLRPLHLQLIQVHTQLVGWVLLLAVILW